MGGIEKELTENIQDNVQDKLTERQQTILSLLKENPFLTAKELSVSMSVTPRTIERDIATLRNLGLIRRKGRKNDGHWEVVKKE